ncbi:MAG: lipopolysaccharide biosynthesis protein [Candidatus Acidiferrales bacterium]
MTELKRLYKDSSHYLLGQILVFVVGFVSFPVFTRVFSVAEYGLMSLTLNTIAMVTVLSKLGLQHSLVRFYPEHAASADSGAKQRYYSTIFFAAAGIAGIITFLYVLSVLGISHQYLGDRLKRLLIFAAVLVFVRAVSSIVMNLWRTEGKTRHYNLVNVGIKAATVAAVLVLLFTWERSLRAFFTGMIGVETAIMIALVVLLWKRKLIRLGMFETAFLQQTLAFGLPMIGFELASLILDNGDRFLVQFYLGGQSLGFYVAAYNLASYVQDAVATPLNLAMMPIYMKLWATKGEQATRKFLSDGLDHFMILSIGIVACMTISARELIVFLSSSKYREAGPLLPILVAGLLVYSFGIYLNAGMLIHKKTFMLARFVLYAAALNMGLNVLLIPRMKLMGAALATLIACVFLTSLMAHQGLKLLPLKFRLGSTLRYLVAGALAALMASRLNFETPFIALAAKGAVFFLLYGGMVWLTSPHLREQFGNFRAADRLLEESPVQSQAAVADESDPLVEKAVELAASVAPEGITKPDVGDDTALSQAGLELDPRAVK